jgi:hypothetical protein
MSAKISQLIVPIMAFYFAAASNAEAQDSQLLIYASKLNVGHRIAEECTEADPRMLAGYEEQLTNIKSALKTKGLTEDVFRKAETIPELSTTQYVEKFRRLSTEQQLKWCIHTILDVQQEALLAQSIK